MKKKIEAKNGLENYLYSVKNSLRDEKLKDKFKEDERKKIEACVEETTKWFETNPDSEPAGFEAK
jgi:heat shock protein 1/8